MVSYKMRQTDVLIKLFFQTRLVTSMWIEKMKIENRNIFKNFIVEMIH